MDAPAPTPRGPPLLHHLRKPAWLYPFKGIWYFAAHPYLYPLFRARLWPCLLLSLLVYSQLFLWTYLPQVAFLALFHGPALCWLNGAVLVLGEGAVVVALLFEAFLADATQVDIFDAVLLAEGHEQLVANGRVLRAANSGEGEGEGAGDHERSNPRERLGKPLGRAGYAPFSLRQLVEFVCLLPLNLVPVAGTPAFLLATGCRAGPFHHWRYFRLLGLTRKERKAAVKKRRLRYTWFGTSALILQLVPGLSMLFLLSTAAGAALWAADLEAAAAGSREAPPEGEYVDDPV